MNICGVTMAAIPTRRGANAGKRRFKGHSTQPMVITRGKGTHKPNVSPARAVAALARLLKKIDQVDPLRCPHCGSEMHLIAWIEQPQVIRKILQHLNLWQRPQRSPPPRLFPHKLEAFLASSSPRQAQQIRASTDSVFWDDVPVWNGPRATSLHSSSHTRGAYLFSSFRTHSCTTCSLTPLKLSSTCHAHYPAPKKPLFTRISSRDTLASKSKLLSPSLKSESGGTVQPASYGRSDGATYESGPERYGVQPTG